MRQTSPFSERTERTVIAVICLDLLLQTVETTEAMTNAATLFFWAGVGIWLLYTVEWFVRIRRAEDWKKYVFSFIGIVDFLAVLPLWAFTGFDLRALRAFRLFRLFVTTAKLATRTSAVVKLARAFRHAMDEAGALFAGTSIVVITAGFGMYHLENGVQPEVFGTVYDGLWWAVVTLTTVGYGDIQPVTAGGGSWPPWRCSPGSESSGRRAGSWRMRCGRRGRGRRRGRFDLRGQHGLGHVK